MTGTLYDRASRFIGINELSAPGQDHPLIQWWLSLCFDGKLDLPDETPWCSAFVNGMAWDLRKARSKSARARSWLMVGTPIRLEEAVVGNDVVVINRGGDASPDVLQSKAHVGLFAGRQTPYVLLLAGNQGNGVNVRRFDVSRPGSELLGVRRFS